MLLRGYQLISCGCGNVVHVTCTQECLSIEVQSLMARVKVEAGEAQLYHLELHAAQETSRCRTKAFVNRLSRGLSNTNQAWDVLPLWRTATCLL